MNEGDLQKGLVAHVRQVHGLYVVEFARAGTHTQLRGVLPQGWPDWCVIGEAILDSQTEVWVTKHVYFETKTLHGHLGLQQDAVHRQLRDLGCRVELIQTDRLAEGIELVEAVLRFERFPLRQWQ